MSRRLSARRAAEELLFPVEIGAARGKPGQPGRAGKEGGCLLYTSDAADE